jgi:hypothetical protein
MQPEWIIAIATCVYAFFMGWYILEMRRDRKLMHRPILRAIISDAKYPDWIGFTIKNIGKGPALNCTASCRDDNGGIWDQEGVIPPIGINDSVQVRFRLSDREHTLGEKTWLDLEYTDILEKIHKERVFEETRINMLTKYRLQSE